MNEQQARQMLELLQDIKDLLKPKASTKMAVKVQPMTDAEWVESLAKDPTYAGIDVKREFGKAKAWADTNKKQVTRRFFINWLNRVERPVQVQGLKQVQPGTPPVYLKTTPRTEPGVPPPPEVAEKLSRLLGGDFMKSMGGGR